MTDPELTDDTLRDGLIEGLLAVRAAEREVLDALDPLERDTRQVDGGWSPKDIQAHLSVWRRRQADRLRAAREEREEPALAATETDEINALFHAERSDWTWVAVRTDADASTDDLIAEVRAAHPDTLDEDRMVGSILGNGPEHGLAHLPILAARVGMTDRVDALATIVRAIVDREDWPPRSAAFARYNLACFHALGGRLDEARALLRQALPAQEELRSLATVDDDLIALRDEIADLTAR